MGRRIPGNVSRGQKTKVKLHPSTTIGAVTLHESSYELPIQGSSILGYERLSIQTTKAHMLQQRLQSKLHSSEGAVDGVVWLTTKKKLYGGTISRSSKIHANIERTAHAMVALSQVCGCSRTRVFFVSPSRHLLCSLCDENFNEVVLPCAGWHTFCRACVRNWLKLKRVCPACREAIPANAALLPNRLARAQVDELRVRCRFGVKAEGDGWVADEAGCSVQLSLDGAAAHEATCGFATFPCPSAECGVEVRLTGVDCSGHVLILYPEVRSVGG